MCINMAKICSQCLCGSLHNHDHHVFLGEFLEIFLHRVCDVTDWIALTACILLSMWLLPISWPNWQMHRLEFLHEGLGKGCQGQSHEVKNILIRINHSVSSPSYNSIFIMGIAIEFSNCLLPAQRLNWYILICFKVNMTILDAGCTQSVCMFYGNKQIHTINPLQTFNIGDTSLVIAM